MKLIDGEQLEEIIYKYYCKRCREKGLDRCRGCKVTNILGFMKKLCGTVEAKPVVRAHWEMVITTVKKIDEYEQEDLQYRCDNCGHIVDDIENYCPGCGAQMFGR